MLRAQRRQNLGSLVNDSDGLQGGTIVVFDQNEGNFHRINCSFSAAKRFLAIID